MSATGDTAEQPALSRERVAARSRERRRPRVRRPAAPAELALRYAGLPLALALSAVLNLKSLSQNGYANIFYSAGVKSMLHSLHNFLFVSFDPGGLISVDKPPLALWVQVASAKVFGFSPMSLLVPGAIESILAVGLLYIVLARRLGGLAALAGSLAFAVFPSFVAVSRDNGVDSLLLLLLLGACAAALAACESGRWRSLLACAVLVGLAFNTKTLAAYLAVPGIAAGYLLCAPGSVRRRVLQLAVAGLVTLALSFAWIAYVELTPGSQRPYVGSSTNNSEIGLTFEYNGFGRVEGQLGGPGTEKVKPGAFVPVQQILSPVIPGRRPPAAWRAALSPSPRRASPHSSAKPPLLRHGREIDPIPFGGPPGPVRLFGKGLGDQGGWLLPFALVGVLALALLLALEYRAGRPAGSARAASAPTPAPARSARRDPRLATLLVLGGWFLVEFVILSSSKGIVHPYYVSGLAPGTGAMAGAGVAAIAALAQARRRIAAFAVALLALAATVGVEVALMHSEHYMAWFAPALIAGCAACLVALVLSRRLAPLAISLALALALVTPAAYAATTWLAPVEGTFPAAGPKRDAGLGGYGVSGVDLAIDHALIGYVRSHNPGTRWALLTVASDEAAPLILMGLRAGALAGYSGTDQALSGKQLARLVQRGQARYVLLGGAYSLRGGNGASKAVLRACSQVRAQSWNSPQPYANGRVLFDCAGREGALARA